MSSFQEELRALINRTSRENMSGTPDHILARFMSQSLDAFEQATNARDRYWNFDPAVGGIVPAKGSPTANTDLSS